VLVVESVELVEFEIGRTGPVETFFGELVLVSVGYSKADVVVVLHALDAAPELQFLKVVLVRAVHKLLDSVLELESLIDIQADSVIIYKLEAAV